MRIGCGYDIHPLGPGRKLILGGIEVPTARVCWDIPIPMPWSMPSAMRCLERWVKEIWADTIPAPISGSEVISS